MTLTALIGTAKDMVVVDYAQRMKEALDHANTIIQHSTQALLLGRGIVADSLHFSLVSIQSGECVNLGRVCSVSFVV